MRKPNIDGQRLKQEIEEEISDHKLTPEEGHNNEPLFCQQVRSGTQAITPKPNDSAPLMNEIVGNAFRAKAEKEAEWQQKVRQQAEPTARGR